MLRFDNEPFFVRSPDILLATRPFSEDLVHTNETIALTNPTISCVSSRLTTDRSASAVGLISTYRYKDDKRTMWGSATATYKELVPRWRFIPKRCVPWLPDRLVHCKVGLSSVMHNADLKVEVKPCTVYELQNVEATLESQISPHTHGSPVEVMSSRGENARWSGTSAESPKNDVAELVAYFPRSAFNGVVPCLPIVSDNPPKGVHSAAGYEGNHPAAKPGSLCLQYGQFHPDPGHQEDVRHNLAATWGCSGEAIGPHDDLLSFTHRHRCGPGLICTPDPYPNGAMSHTSPAAACGIMKYTFPNLPPAAQARVRQSFAQSRLAMLALSHCPVERERAGLM
eukprot:TRINITY_DN21518_c0_g1_i1.p1 TRINITY_DN21518_c0_g1~~TRINITY_DN21518_c0_g1_i1.p1  ORF type:complete len:340 (+),score=17.10 TRINITY_DN21518_c0_g1_i1:170-1189(+)